MHGSFSLNPEDRALLRSNPVFAGLDFTTFENIASRSGVVTYGKGEQIFQAGDRADHFFIVASGIVQLYHADLDGVEKTVNLFRRSQSFGEAVMFLGRAYPVSAQCLESTRLIRVEAKELMVRIRENPDMAFGLLAAMSSHLRMLVDEITLLRAPSALHRVAEFLLRHMPLGDGPQELELPYSKTVIARQLGITPEVLSRTFAQLRKHDVTVERETVTIADISALHRLVGLDDD